MARIKWSAIGITNASGKSGGSVFSHNRAGAYVRRWAKPVNRQSNRQTEMRSLWGMVSQQWGRLSQESVNLWNSVAQNTQITDGFGDTRNMTGFTLFMRTNQNRTHGMGLPFTDVPLPLDVMPSIDIVNLAPNFNPGADSASAFKIEMGNGSPLTKYTASIGFAVVSAGRNRGFGSVKNKFNDRLRKEFTTNADGNANVLVSNAELEAVIGKAGNQSTLFLQVHNHSAGGQKSNPVTEKARVDAPIPPNYSISVNGGLEISQGSTVDMMLMNGTEIVNKNSFTIEGELGIIENDSPGMIGRDVEFSATAPLGLTTIRAVIGGVAVATQEVEIIA